MKGFPDLPPIWFALFWALGWALSWVWPGPWAGGLATALSWGCIACGLALIFWAAFWFWRRKTTIEPHHAPGALIVEGPFRISRNPIYLGLAVILLGSVIGKGQPLGLILVPLFVYILHRRFVLPEAQGLRDAFGPAAEDYISKTRAWL